MKSFRRVLTVLLMVICVSTVTASDNAGVNAGENAGENKTDAGKRGPRTADDRVLAGPKAGADAIKRTGRGLTGKGKGRHKRQAIVMQTLKELKLSEQQMQQVRKMLPQVRAARKKFHKKFGPQLKQMKEQMRSARESGDRDKMRQLAASRKKMMEKSGVRTAMKQKLAQILTPDQMKQFEQKMREHHRKARSGKKKRGRGKRPDGPKPSDTGTKQDSNKLDI